MNERRWNLIAKILTLAIFLALIRCILEPLRLQYHSTSILTVHEIRMFLYGAAIGAVSLFIIALLSAHRKNKLITLVAFTAILLLLLLKWFMM